MQDYKLFQRAGLIGGLLLFPIVLALPTPEGMSPEGHRTGAVALLMAVWWMSEAAPLAATALLPIALFPLLGVLPGKDVTLSYGHDTIFLFAGGFFIAMAMQKWNLHERLALHVVARAGRRLDRLVFGFMAATAFLSLWISNTATALMMVPIGMAVAEHVTKTAEAALAARFRICLLLAIAYAASIGGIGTLIGTPPNIVLAAQFTALFPDAPPIGFAQWMLVGIPLVASFVPSAWWLLTRPLFRLGGAASPDAAGDVRARLEALGPMSLGERIVLGVAILTSLAWIFRANIELGTETIPGWSGLFPLPGHINDSTVAIFFAALLFIIPVDWKRGEFALDWSWARLIPWDVLILFGGGLALAQAFEKTGLVAWFGSHFVRLEGAPPALIVLSCALLLTVLTELTSNTATTAIMMPILAGASAQALGLHPLLLMIPGAISASCAFMLPVATPPNAVIFAGGHITVAQMARAGILLNLAGAIIVTLVTLYIAVPVFGIDVNALPEWAVKP